MHCNGIPEEVLLSALQWYPRGGFALQWYPRGSFALQWYPRGGFALQWYSTSTLLVASTTAIIASSMNNMLFVLQAMIAVVAHAVCVKPYLV